MTTEVLKIESLNKEAKIGIERAAKILNNKGLVVFPTETVYGLGAIATDSGAASKIYEAKGRPSDNPLIIHIAEPEDAETYAYVNDTYRKLAKAFMPGPITVVLPSKETVPKTTRGGLSTVAIRCPIHPIAHALILATGVPIAAPSANRSGSPSPTTAKHVLDDMNGRVDMIIDGGSSDFGLESTIVSIDGEDEVTLLRPGKITVEDLQSVVKNVKIADAVTSALKTGEIALSPGMKYRHYAPKAPVYLLQGDCDSMIAYVKSLKKGRYAFLCFEEERERVITELPEIITYNFGKKNDKIEQSHNLFYILREADKESYDGIFAPLPTKDGVGLALYNRMIRAAAYQIITL